MKPRIARQQAVLAAVDRLRQLRDQDVLEVCASGHDALRSGLDQGRPHAEPRAAVLRVERERAAITINDDPPGGGQAETVPCPTSFVVKNGSELRGDVVGDSGDSS
jgi:hypothetical protein